MNAQPWIVTDRVFYSNGDRFLMVDRSAVHIVRNPSAPAYMRYYDFVGLLASWSPQDPLFVQIYGAAQQYDGQRWVLRLKAEWAAKREARG